MEIEIAGLKGSCPRKGAEPFNLVNGSYLTKAPKNPSDFFLVYNNFEGESQLIRISDVRSLYEANLWAKGYFEGSDITSWHIYEKLS